MPDQAADDMYIVDEEAPDAVPASKKAPKSSVSKPVKVKVRSDSGKGKKDTGSVKSEDLVTHPSEAKISIEDISPDEKKSFSAAEIGKVTEKEKVKEKAPEEIKVERKIVHSKKGDPKGTAQNIKAAKDSRSNLHKQKIAKQEVSAPKDDKNKKNKEKKTKPSLSSHVQILLWVVAIIFIIALLLFIRSREPTPDATIHPDENISKKKFLEPVAPIKDESDFYTTTESHEEERKVGIDVVDKDELANPAGVDVTSHPELFSNIECLNDTESGLFYINLRIYNDLEDAMRISNIGVSKGYNTYFLIRGIVDKDPGCSKEILEPGDMTVCDKIGFDDARFALKSGLNRISVQVPGKTEALLVECGQ